MSNLGEWTEFIEARKAKGLSLNTLSKELGVDKKTIYDWYTGKHNLRDSKYKLQIEKVLGIVVPPERMIKKPTGRPRKQNAAKPIKNKLTTRDSLESILWFYMNEGLLVHDLANKFNYSVKVISEIISLYRSGYTLDEIFKQMPKAKLEKPSETPERVKPKQPEVEEEPLPDSEDQRSEEPENTTLDFVAEKERRQFITGAVRDKAEGKGRCDLLPADAILRLSKLYESGAKHYGERNWEKGIPASSFADSAIRHMLRWLNGDNDEDHLAAAAFNIFGLMRLEGCMPDLIDVPSRQG